MSAEAITGLMMGSLIILIMLGYPIAYVMGGLGTLFGFLFIGKAFSGIFVLRMYSVFSDYILVAVLLFIFMGVVIEKSGLASKLYESMYYIFGRLRGGLAVAVLITCTIFAAATGVIGASVVTMGLLALPTMLKYNYDKPLATGVICAGGTLGILIPPSVMILVYGPMAGLSVGKLLMGAFIPGVMLAGLYIIYVLILCYFKPQKGPGISSEEDIIPLGKKVKLFAVSVVPVAALILAVLGSIFFGLTAPTEAAALGCFGALLLAWFYRALTLKVLKEVIYQTVKVASMVFLVVVGANIFTSVFMRLGCSRVVEDLIMSLPVPQWAIIWLMFGVVFIMGAFIDWIGILMIVVPLFTPIAANLGVDAIWFAMMIIIVMQTSFLTPPFAYSIFYLKGIAPPEVTTLDIYKGVVPFILLQLLGILIFYLFPEVILFLPNMMVK